MKKIEKSAQADNSKLYESIETYANRRNVLSKLVIEIQANGFTPGYVETELASVELADVVDELRGIPAKEAIKILQKQIEKYENLIKRLMK